jgi:hypothetical protein
MEADAAFGLAVGWLILVAFVFVAVVVLCLRALRQGGDVDARIGTPSLSLSLKVRGASSLLAPPNAPGPTETQNAHDRVTKPKGRAKVKDLAGVDETLEHRQQKKD